MEEEPSLPRSKSPEEFYQEEQTDPLGKLERRLYTNDQRTDFNTPSLPRRAPPPATGGWHVPPPPPAVPRKPISVTALFLFGAVLFFIVAGGISFLFLLQGGRSVSSNNIAITVQGPTTIASGTAVPLAVAILNHNPAAIVDATITLDFPEGTRSTTDVTQSLPRYTENLGSVPAGGTANRTVQAVLFGNAEQAITIPVTIEYHTANSNAVFRKQQSYTFTITSSPLAITARAVSTVAVGQPVTVAVTVRSNAITPLPNIGVSIQYPAGFTALSISSGTTGSSTSSVTSLVNLGTLAPGESKNFSIIGTFTGSTNDQRAFNFTVGTAKGDGSPALAVAYASQSTPITISKPFLSSTLTLKHSTDDPTVVKAGDTVDGLITWANTLTSAITHGTVSINLSGTGLDTSGVSTGSGYYNSSKNSIEFTQQSSPSLANLLAGASDSGSFIIKAKDSTALKSIQNPTILLTVAVAGQTSEGMRTITNTLTHTIQVATNLVIMANVTHANTYFTNTGALPPVPNQPTTYTIQLAVTNTVNSVGGAVATMVLPTYVTFVGQQTTSSGQISYDDASRTVTWRIGDVPAGTLVKPLTAVFQVSFLPSTSQSGLSPTIVGDQTLTGTDRFTSAQVGNVNPGVTIQTPNDPGYTASYGTVSH